MDAQEKIINGRPAMDLFWTAVLLSLIPWVVLRFVQATNSNIAWFLVSAERFLGGGTFARDFFDPNPPLAVLLYVPPVLLHDFTGIPVYTAASLYLGILAALAFVATFAILKSWGFLGRNDKALILLSFIVTHTILTSIEFGERDQILALSLYPFALVQIALTGKLPMPKRWLREAILWSGALLLLLKPHYGILPVALLLHRAIVQKRLFSIMRDPDFIALFSCTAGYVASVFVFFPDYIREILPDIGGFYMLNRNPNVMSIALFFGACSAIFMLVAAATGIETDKRKLVYFFLLSALVSLVPYVVQGRGYHYHLLAFLSFLFSGMFLLFSAVLPRITGEKGALWGLGVILVGVCYTLTPLNLKYPHHDLYKTAFPLTRTVLDNIPDASCPFFLFNESMEFTHQISVYNDLTHGSRFPSYWFIPRLIRDPGLKENSDKYIRMVGEDFRRYKPCVAIIGQFILSEEGVFDYIHYFSRSPDFAKEWGSYGKKETLVLNRGEYYPGTAISYDYPMIFDVYVRNPD